jgi:hypothetical protein
MHSVPSARGWLEQVPVLGSQLACWHASPAAQVTASAPLQNPDRQLSVRVQALWSSQAVPFGAVGFEQRPVAGLQVPAL